MKTFLISYTTPNGKPNQAAIPARDVVEALKAFQENELTDWDAAAVAGMVASINRVILRD